MLKKIKIEGLFKKFNYEIELKEEGITILTGPNGYGKTTILKIIYAFAMRNLAFFFQIPFKEIVLTQKDNEIRLSKTGRGTLEIKQGNKKPISYKKNDIIKETQYVLLQNSSYTQVDENHWVDRKTNTLYPIDNLLSQISQTIENYSGIQYINHTDRGS